MRFTIVKNSSGMQPPQTSFDFYPPGGTIGRSEDNNFVLPDESRAISRLQLLVHTSANGECRITNRGNVINIEFNGIPLEHGRQVELQSGDLLGIGDYSLAVSDLDGSAPSPAVQPQQAPLRAAPRTAEAIPGEIWESLARDFTPPPPPARDAAPAVANPLTAAPGKELNPVDPLAQQQTFTDLHQLSPRETDPARLFNENDLFQQPDILQDATPSALRAAPQAAPLHPEASQECDPLALFGHAAGKQEDPFGIMVEGAQSLTPPDIFTPPPAPQSSPQPVAPPAQQASLQSVPPPAPQKAEPEPLPMQPASAPAPERAATPKPEVAAPSPSGYNHVAGRRMGIDPVSYQRAGQARSAQGCQLEGELLQALLAGADLQDMDGQPAFGKQQMFLVGQLLSLFSQGTVALLSSRSMLKRGVNAEMTMILDEANNPFKLLPSGKTVLIQMFGSQMPGFMSPEKAVRDALIDLQAHQLGMIAGIRAIIAAMLQSFNPEKIESQARDSGRTPRFALASARKAALWDYFVQRFHTTADEIDDDFHTLFGEAFLRAYDIEVNQYKDLQTKNDGDR
ncbi:MAG: type VI secretion system-associated FHA domain protein TagH [Pantoea sp.]|nr:type VI secretion system-associated FHA domain protein TagH [Pantoea sp.]